MKPFLKWAGGKSFLLPELNKYIPNKINTYFEPFVGGGALFFDIKPGRFNEAILADSNLELINTYRQLRDNFPDLVEQLYSYNRLYQLCTDRTGSGEIVYYGIRHPNSKLDPVEKAARFIFLNKTGYNGLYRVNAKGEFNTPYGYYKNPNILESDVLHKCSIHLLNAKLVAKDFRKIIPKAKRGDFVYLDPPYIPVKKTSFVAYGAGKFTEDDHVALANMFDLLTRNKVSAILSNSATKLTRNLYRKYDIREVEAPRRINSNGKARGNVTEYIISNFT